MIDETINYVKNKGYKEPKYSIQYLEDREGTAFGDVGNLAQYMSQQKITKSITYNKSGSTVSIRSGDEAVGFEVVDGSEVKFFSNKLNFNISKDVWTDSCKLYAVQSDGKRFELK